MKKTITKYILLSSILPLAAAGVQAQTGTSTAASFLRVATDARSAAMGDAGIAISPDAAGSLWNASKMPFAKSKAGVSVNYSPWMRDVAKDMNLYSASGYYKLDDMQVLSASLRYFSLGDVQYADYDGNKLGNSKPREFAFDLAYSRKLSAKFGLGIALRYINSKLVSGTVNNINYKSGNAVAGDVSLFYNGAKENGEGFTAGLALTNLGSKISYTADASRKDFLPANLGIGGAYTKVFDEQNRITVALDINKLLVPQHGTDSVSIADYYNKGIVESWGSGFGSGSYQFSGGLEYAYDNFVFIRAGYNAQTKSPSGTNYFTAGAGVHYSKVGINFSYLIPTGSGTNKNPLSNTMRFSLLFDIDKN